jgi:hypothetical protein
MARIWGKQVIEKESRVLGDADPSSVLPADFIIPFENIYREKPPARIRVELKSLNLYPTGDSVATTPTLADGPGATPFSDISSAPGIHTYTPMVSFTITNADTGEAKDHSLSISQDINFVTAHPCVPSQHVKILKSPSSPTIQQVDLTGRGGAGKTASAMGTCSRFL